MLFPFPVIHVMTLANGVYTCPYCGRRVTFQGGRLVVLERGDQAAVHRYENAVVVFAEIGT